MAGVEHFGTNRQVKAKKCQLERIRRQRINDKLEKLKIILMKNLGNDVGFYPPMEKADILELAIKYLEGKETSALENLKNNENKENAQSPQRQPLATLTENLQTPEMKREIDVTPTRDSPFQIDGKCDKRESRKPILNHPIKAFRLPKNSPVKSRKIARDPLRQINNNNLSINRSRQQQIWRPWDL